jgi:hypothetical protein
MHFLPVPDDYLDDKVPEHANLKLAVRFITFQPWIRHLLRALRGNGAATL